MSSVQFDSDGDVILVISSEAQRTARFQVNSHCLCLASSVFRAMLGVNAHFTEGNALRNRDARSPPVDVTLGDDDPKALALLLRVVHHQYAWIPKTLSDDHLYEIAIVCDKYDMRQILEPWLDQWIPVDTQVGGKIAGDQWLFIAYVFGRQDLFTGLSKDLILTSTVDAGGSLLALLPMSDVPDARRSFNHYIPSAISGRCRVRFNSWYILTGPSGDFHMPPTDNQRDAILHSSSDRSISCPQSATLHPQDAN